MNDDSPPLKRPRQEETEEVAQEATCAPSASTSSKDDQAASSASAPPSSPKEDEVASIASTLPLPSSLSFSETEGDEAVGASVGNRSEEEMPEPDVPPIKVPNCFKTGRF